MAIKITNHTSTRGDGTVVRIGSAEIGGVDVPVATPAAVRRFQAWLASEHAVSVDLDVAAESRVDGRTAADFEDPSDVT